MRACRVAAVAMAIALVAAFARADEVTNAQAAYTSALTVYNQQQNPDQNTTAAQAVANAKYRLMWAQAKARAKGKQ